MSYLKILSILLLLSLLSFGCVVEPEYTLECNSVRCHNADDTSNFQSGDDLAYTCTWHCVDYDGQSNVYVSMTFWSWDGGCWQLDSVYVDDGVCY